MVIVITVSCIAALVRRPTRLSIARACRTPRVARLLLCVGRQTHWMERKLVTRATRASRITQHTIMKNEQIDDEEETSQHTTVQYFARVVAHNKQ